MSQDLELLKPSQIIYSKRKTISLIIKEGGEFIVRSPKKITESKIFELIRKKQDWILKTRLKLIQISISQPKIEFEDGQFLPLLGQQIMLKFNDAQQKECIFDPTNLVLAVNPAKNPAKKTIIAWLQKQARAKLDQELKSWAQTMRLNPKQFRLSSAKTRWGSCSGKNVISLNWRLILTPIEVLHYVVIHELAHIEHKNHSIHFWNLVSKFDENYREDRKYLKTQGASLMHNFS